MTADSKDSSSSPSSSPFGIPGTGDLHEVIDSMQKAWGFNAATPMTPTLDIDEIDRRLQDLNTISQWLSLNQNMLQSTIQTLRVQRATLAAIQSFGSAAQNNDGKGKDQTVSPVDVMQAFTNMFSPPQGTSAKASSAPAAPRAGSGSPSSAANPTPGSHAAGAGDPQQWWAMLQNQFAQVASAALETQKTATRAATKKSTATKSAPKKASRKPAKPKSS